MSIGNPRKIKNKTLGQDLVLNTEEPVTLSSPISGFFKEATYVRRFPTVYVGKTGVADPTH
jgi:hypothetical protein